MVSSCVIKALGQKYLGAPAGSAYTVGSSSPVEAARRHPSWVRKAALCRMAVPGPIVGGSCPPLGSVKLSAVITSVRPEPRRAARIPSPPAKTRGSAVVKRFATSDALVGAGVVQRSDAAVPPLDSSSVRGNCHEVSAQPAVMRHAQISTKAI